MKRLDAIIEQLQDIDGDQYEEIFTTVTNTVNEFARAFNGSWLGHQSRIYYENFQEPPPGVRFSPGVAQAYRRSIQGDEDYRWCNYRLTDVEAAILDQAGNPETPLIRSTSKAAGQVFEDCRDELRSIASATHESHPNDSFLSELSQKLGTLKLYTTKAVIDSLTPKGEQWVCDPSIVNEGIQVPPHVAIQAEFFILRDPFKKCQELKRLATQLGLHVEQLSRAEKPRLTARRKIFIGHGRSKLWKELREFINERLGLSSDEFNRISVAGVTNIDRLSQMLDDAAFAFLILTAEDEQADGKRHARMNVFHEAGLFQGRLGFEKAIVMLEDGCEEFSNIQGLGQIRFPEGQIEVTFEEIRRILEREGIVACG